MSQKKVYRLNLTIALEAKDRDEAYQLLLSDVMSEQIKTIIKDSKNIIVEVFEEEQKNKVLLS